MFKGIVTHFNRKNLKDENYSFLFDKPPLDEVIVYDTETTGLNPKKDEILSIGAVKIRGNKILTSEKFELFVTVIVLGEAINEPLFKYPVSLGIIYVTAFG